MEPPVTFVSMWFSPWLAFGGEGYSFLSPPCLFHLYFKHSRMGKKKSDQNILVYVSETFKANAHLPFEKSLSRDLPDGPVFKIHASNAEGAPWSGG